MSLTSQRRCSISENPLEYAAEVAYIVATSPPPAAEQDAVSEGEDEFSFSFSQAKLRTVREEDENDDNTGDQEEEKEMTEATADDKLPLEETDSPALMLPRNNSDISWGKDVASAIETTNPKTIVIYGATNYANRQLVNRLVQSNPSLFTAVVPHTSRRQRLNEVNGVDFHFVGRKKMSSELKRGQFVECVKIFASPKLHKKRTASIDSATNAAQPSGPASPSGEGMESLRQVQVPSPLLTPKSGRDRKKSGNSCDLYGTSREAIERARQQGKPGIVLNVTCKGAQQLRKSSLEGVYILLEVGEKDGPESSIEDSIQPDYCIKTLSVSEQAYLELQRIAFEQISSLPLSPRTKTDVTRDEWDGLPTVELDHTSNTPTSPLSKSRHLTFTDLLVHYQRQRIGTKPMKKSKKEAPSLSKSLRAECDLVSSLKAEPLSDTDPLHIEALQTVYQKLTGSSLNCRRYGPHWLDVGFPGVDPAESLKEVGFFGLMQLVAFLDRSLSLATEIFNYSCHSTQQFPFAVISISLTEAALNALREGHLSKLCNKQEQVVVILNDYHEALFHRFYLVWRSQSTPSQISPIIKEVATYARKNQKKVLEDVLAYHQSGKDEHELTPTRRISHSLSNPFTPFPILPDQEDTLTSTTSSHQ